MEGGASFYPSFSAGPDERVLRFLRKNGLDARPDAACTVTLVTQAGDIAATGSLDGNVLKYIACDAAYRGEGLIAQVVSLLVEEACARGKTDLFMFTSQGNTALFGSLGFKEISAYGGAALLERGGGLKRYLTALSASARPGTCAAIVMKADPFTLGHRHLVEYAAARADWLHIFALREDRACFPPAARESMIRAGVADLPNVTVHAGSDYVISAATFPTYFIKEADSRARVQAGLDAVLFGRHIAKTLGITKRFVGQEPLSPTTAVYNQALLEALPPLQVQVEIIPRIALENAPVSASRVRALIKSGDMRAALRLVPESTARYLQSKDGLQALSAPQNTEE